MCRKCSLFRLFVTFLIVGGFCLVVQLLVKEGIDSNKPIVPEEALTEYQGCKAVEAEAHPSPIVVLNKITGEETTIFCPESQQQQP